MNDMRQFMNVLTEGKQIDELKAMGKIGKVKDAVMGKLGNQKAQANQEAKPAAEEMYKKWQQANKEAGNQLNTVPAMVKWLENSGTESDVVKAGFQGVGVKDISAFAKEEDKVGIMKWLDDEMIQPGALTGQVAKQFLVAQGVPEERAEAMLDRIGVKADGGKIVSTEQREKLDTIVQKFGSGDEGDEEVAGDEKTVDATTPANEVHQHMLANYKTDKESMDAAFDQVGVDPASTEPMGDEAFDGLADLYSDADKKEGGSTDEPAADGETPTGEWPVSKVREYILNKYDIEPEAVDAALKKASGDEEIKLENPIGDDALEGVTDAIKGADTPEKETGAEDGAAISADDAMEKVQGDMEDVGKSVGKATQQGKAAAESGDTSGQTELQKLGMAVLTARKKI